MYTVYKDIKCESNVIWKDPTFLIFLKDRSYSYHLKAVLFTFEVLKPATETFKINSVWIIREAFLEIRSVCNVACEAWKNSELVVSWWTEQTEYYAQGFEWECEMTFCRNVSFSPMMYFSCLSYKSKKKMSIRNDNNRKEEPLTHLKLVQALLKEGCRKIPLKIHEMPSSTLQRASPIEAYAKNWPTRNS